MEKKKFSIKDYASFLVWVTGNVIAPLTKGRAGAGLAVAVGNQGLDYHIYLLLELLIRHPRRAGSRQRAAT